MSSHRLKSIGVPHFIATGNIDYGGTKYRFLVMERFGTDLQKMFEESGKQFPTHTVFLLGIKLVIFGFLLSNGALSSMNNFMH
jgi:vaccinia related kinase